jgi:subtilisin family serine protease
VDSASGTSFAAPFVAGAIGVYLSSVPADDVIFTKPQAAFGKILARASKKPAIGNVPDGTPKLSLEVSGI